MQLDKFMLGWQTLYTKLAIMGGRGKAAYFDKDFPGILKKMNIII